MKEGKAKLEESANLVEVVSHEIKSKEEQIDKAKKKLKAVIKLFKGSAGSKESSQGNDLTLESLCDVSVIFGSN